MAKIRSYLRAKAFRSKPSFCFNVKYLTSQCKLNCQMNVLKRSWAAVFWVEWWHRKWQEGLIFCLILQLSCLCSSFRIIELEDEHQKLVGYMFGGWIVDTLFTTIEENCWHCLTRRYWYLWLSNVWIRSQVPDQKSKCGISSDHAFLATWKISTSF